ncbi:MULTISPECIES: pyridoxamine 5'-phosphate oxidase family protein [Roseovarius]|jgi:general stress protein 26|uniref:pyridoxamine 5'-phosphate oxidase family protein n=1 Tax=Roseovarius TaxID=74030 RepID=UPI00273D31A2|nr:MULTISPECIES: pyridoxamine 5'-phosphate oxidase family protein [unclassified Roseovarius]
MSDDLKEALWKRLDSLQAGMLSTTGAPPRPMAPTITGEDDAIWFVTAKGTDIAAAAVEKENCKFIAACPSAQLYADIDGELSVETSEAKLDEIWSPMAAVWFEDGRQDDDIVLVCMRPKKAVVWATDGNAKSLFEFARASLSGDTPDVGTHGTVTF